VLINRSFHIIRRGETQSLHKNRAFDVRCRRLRCDIQILLSDIGQDGAPRRKASHKNAISVVHDDANIPMKPLQTQDVHPI